MPASKYRSAVIPTVGLLAGLLVGVTLPAQVASAAPKVVASDSFSRNITSGWGSTGNGGAWQTSKSGATQYSVSSGAGQISNLVAGTSASAVLPTVSAQDVSAEATLTVPGNGTGMFHAFELRRQSDGSLYRARFNVGSSGNLSLALSRVNKKAETALKTVALPIKASGSSQIRLQFFVTGTTNVEVQGRAWKVGSPQPSWALDYTDSSSSRIATAGSVGLWDYASSSNRARLDVTFDDIAFTSNPASAPESTPPATTPPAQPSEPSTPATGTRGAAPIGSTSYSVPKGALFVSSSGSTSASGTEASPFRTVTQAVAAASTGDTIVLRGGVYNESVSIPMNKSLTIQAYPKEAVWFDGSKQVTSWTKSSSTWTTPWSFFPTTVFDGVADNPRYVEAAHPLAARMDMVFVDGKQLTQVASATAVTSGTFAVDPGSNRVILGDDPAGHEVRISNLGQAIFSVAPNTTLQGFGVRRYANDFGTIGAVRLANINSTVKNVEIDDTSYIGINVSNNNGNLDHITVRRSGMLGVGVNASYGFHLTNSIVDDNNLSFFKPAPVSGGVKITRSRGVTVQNNEISNNHSVGFWCDESCYDVAITGNTVESNRLTGIQVELSQKVVIADNVLTSQNANVLVANTGDVRIVNNSMSNHGLFDIQLRQDSRRAANVSITGHDKRQPLPDPTVSWITKDISILNNAFGASGIGFQIYGLDMDNKNVTITGNVFNRRVSKAQSTLVAWGTSPTTDAYIHYESPEALASDQGTSWRNTQTTDVLPIEKMTSLLATVAQGIASPLPDDIAKLVDQKAGTKHVGSFQ